MKKLNRKGFALAETLIVSVFVMTIFTVIYVNFFPVFGEYERREAYDDVDSMYKTYLVKKMIESSDFIGIRYFDSITETSPYKLFKTSDSSTCSRIMNSSGVDYCKNLMTELKATDIVFTNYKLMNLKNYIKNNNSLGSSLNDYIKTLPYYSNDANNKKNLKYRIIVVYQKKINEESNASSKTITSYSTIGVDVA